MELEKMINESHVFTRMGGSETGLVSLAIPQQNHDGGQSELSGLVRPVAVLAGTHAQFREYAQQQCTVCGYIGKNPADLRWHYRREHDTESVSNHDVAKTTTLDELLT